MRIVLSLFIFLLFSVSSVANSNDLVSEEDHFSSCFIDIINLDFESAKSKIANHENRVEQLYLQHYQLFLSSMVERNNVSIEDYKARFSEVVSELKNNENDPHTLVFLSEVYLQRSILEYHQNKLYAALASFSSAYSYYRKSAKSASHLTAYTKLEAIYQLIFSNIPKQQANVASWVGIKGNQELGFDLLQKYKSTIKGQVGLEKELLLIEAYAHLKFNVSDEQIENLLEEESRNIESPFLKAILIQCAFKIKQPLRYESWLTREESKFWMLQYLSAKYQLLAIKPIGVMQMENFVSNNEFNDYKADGLSLLSWFANVNSDTINYWRYQSELINLESYPTGEDKKAKYEAELRHYNNEAILKARMLFDIGDFKQAISVLDASREIIEANDILEYHYRYGRALDYLQKDSEALIQYKKTIALAEKSKRYFGPYAAIFAAQIETKKGHVQGAIYYYNKAKKMNTGEYKNAISIKIDMALDVL